MGSHVSNDVRVMCGAGRAEAVGPAVGPGGGAQDGAQAVCGEFLDRAKRIRTGAHTRRPRQRRRPIACFGGYACRHRSAGRPWSSKRSSFRLPRPDPPAACALVRPWPDAAWWRATMGSCRRPGRAASGVAAPRSRWGAGHQIGGPEPRGQRQLGSVYRRTGRHRGLLATVGAFMGAGLGRKRPPPAAATDGTDVSCRPAQGDQIDGAGILVEKTLSELRQEMGKVGHFWASQGGDVSYTH